MEEEKKPESVPYFVFESEITRAEIRFKRLFVALIVAIIGIVASNGAWLLYESMYDTISYSQDGEGINNINTGEQGDLYGTESSDKSSQKP